MKTYTEQELRELDAWISGLMEEQPTSMPLIKVRRGRDADYNSAYQTSRGGWWVCETGSDAEQSNLGEQTPCIWEPNYKITSEPDLPESQAAAMQVLEKCAEKLDGFEIVIGRHQYRMGEPDRFMVCSSNRREFQSIAPTLPLAICLFAKQLFGKDQ